MLVKYVLLCALVASIAPLGRTQTTEITVSGIRFSREVTDHGTIYTSNEARYIVSSDELNWVNATAACNALGSRLVSLESSTKYETIRSLLINGGHKGRHWSSGILSYNALWLWGSTGQPFSSTGFTAYAPGEPNNISLMDDCLYIDADYGWFDQDCSYALSYVCE